MPEMSPEELVVERVIAPLKEHLAELEEKLKNAYEDIGILKREVGQLKYAQKMTYASRRPRFK